MWSQLIFNSSGRYYRFSDLGLLLMLNYEFEEKTFEENVKHITKCIWNSANIWCIVALSWLFQKQSNVPNMLLDIINLTIELLFVGMQLKINVKFGMQLGCYIDFHYTNTLLLQFTFRLKNKFYNEHSVVSFCMTFKCTALLFQLCLNLNFRLISLVNPNTLSLTKFSSSCKQEERYNQHYNDLLWMYYMVGFN